MPHHPAAGDTAVFRGVSINITSNYFDVEIKKKVNTILLYCLSLYTRICVQVTACVCGRKMVEVRAL